MNKFLQALIVLITSLLLTSPASAQLSGFASVDTFFTTPNPLFGARVGLNYGLNLNENTDLSLRFRFTYLSAINVLLAPRVNSRVGDKWAIGGEVFLSFTATSVVSSFGITLRPYARLTLVDSYNLAVLGVVFLNTPIFPAFALQPSLALNLIFVNDALGIDLGVKADFQVLPTTGFIALFSYAHLNYDVSSSLRIFTGAAVSTNFTIFNLEVNGLFGEDFRGIYAGLRYNVSDMFAVRLTTGYVGAFYVTLTGILR
jgi:hypothetical protein